MLSWLPVVVALLGGGAMGAIIKELFDRRKSRTKTIPLVELVNRDPLLYELKGVRLLQDRADGARNPVGKIQHYQFRLRNTSGVHVHNAEIQFMFGRADDVIPWTAAPRIGKAELVRLDPAPLGEKWETGFRWRIPQFPSGDSVELGFQSVNPIETAYDAYLETSSNIALEITTVDPLGEKRPASRTDLLLGTLGAGVAALSAGVAVAIWTADRRATPSPVFSLGSGTQLQIPLFEPLKVYDTGLGVTLGVTRPAVGSSGNLYCEYNLRNTSGETLTVRVAAGRNEILSERVLNAQEASARVFYLDGPIVDGSVKVSVRKGRLPADEKDLLVPLCGFLAK